MKKFKINNKIIGLIVMRGMPIHNGHYKLISKALVECDIVIIVLGSIRSEVSKQNPFKISKRLNMIKILFGNNDRLKVIPIADIGASSTSEWVNHVIDTIVTNNLPVPTDFYAGDETNAKWHSDKIFMTGTKMNIHHVDRTNNGEWSGTMIRDNIISGFDDWKKHVPVCLHSYVNDNFPVQLTNEWERKNGVWNGE